MPEREAERASWTHIRSAVKFGQLFKFLGKCTEPPDDDFHDSNEILPKEGKKLENLVFDVELFLCTTLERVRTTS